MRAAFVLHLFYPDLAVALVDRVGRSSGGRDVIVTTPDRLPAAVQAALDRLPNRVDVIRTANRGWDVGPLFDILPLLAERDYDLICKLHTKQGGSGYAAEWRDLFHRALIGSDAVVARIVGCFEADPTLMLAGPEALYKSAGAHRFRNGEMLEALAPRLSVPGFPPSDWGFFAGTMFWARRGLIERLAVFAAEAGGASDGADAERDGARAHAMERLFGLVPAVDGGRIGLVTTDGAGEAAVRLIAAPGQPSHESVVQTLVAHAEASAGIIDAALAAQIARANPLVHYIRHGRDADALDPNPYFSSTWYNRVNADVFAAGMHPLGHYMHHGAFEDRSTGPLFDMGFYMANNPEVAASRLDPLRHFLEHGVPAGKPAIPGASAGHDEGEARPRRFYPAFDLERERAFLHGLAGIDDDVRDRARAVPVSIVMPVHDRADRVGAAIRSVLAQTHSAWELLVVDDGSTDGSAAAVEPFLADPRIRLIRAPHGGVSAARNIGLDAATGEIVAYLDADNRWKPWMLEVMALFMTSAGLEAAYCGIEVRDDLGHLAGYRGDDFDWDACLEQNYVDLNAFCHRRALADTLGGFDPALRRMVDWDLILRYGRGRTVGYAPFAGCEYFDGKGDARRITMREPAAFRQVVQAKHGGGPVSLSFAIKVAAPEAEKTAWGDYHFADSLRGALERLGHVVHIDFRDRWHVRPVAQEDVAIVLRGLIPYQPQPGQIAFLWNISHPDQVDFAEYDRFSRVYMASRSGAEWLRPIVRPPVDMLLQAVDAERFHPRDAEGAGPPVLFCGNSRGVDRPIVRWAIEADRPPVLYGGGWDGRVPDGLVRAEVIDNRALGDLYARAGAVLNDHWDSMRAFGFLSNRLFDVVASGGRAVSDRVPSLRTVFGDAVAEVDGAAGLAAAIDAPPASPAHRRAMAEAVLADHGFDARARTLVADAYALLGLPSPHGARPAPAEDRRLRVHAIAPFGPHGPQSSFFIRLLAPLTDDRVAHRIALTLGRAEDAVPPCDVCIVQRTALPSVAAANALIRTLGTMGAALVVDVDDAFAAIGPDHPEQARYRPLNAALERCMEAAAECWFSTVDLAGLYGRRATRTHIHANALDPRFWRDYRQVRAPVLGDGSVRMLMMGTHTHGADFEMIRPALDRLAAERPGSFDLTLVGVAAEIAPAPWLHRLPPPADAIAYPRFVHWLRAQGPFDMGLAPLTDTPFNRAKSDIKLLDYAALGLLPVVSDCPAYRADARAAALAVRVGGSADGWHDALTAVLDDRSAHAGRAASLHEHLWTARAVGQQAEALADRLEALERG